MTVWLLILLLMGGLIYLNQIGLPGFVKKPVLEKLRARGLDLQFSRLRLRWYEGIVAEKVHFGRADQPFGPRLTAQEVRVLFSLKALTRLRVQIDSVVLRQGRLVWPLAQGVPRELAAENLHTRLRFLPGDQWSLDDFKAEFAGAHIELSGIVTNASAVRDWPFFQATAVTPRAAELWPQRLTRLADVLERIHFAAPPELRLNVEGDARDLQSFKVRMLLEAPGADTPWGALSRGHFSTRVFPAANGQSRAELNLQAANAQTRWGAITNLALDIRLATGNEQGGVVNGSLKLSALSIQTDFATASDALFTAQWLHSITNPVPLSGEGQLECARVQTRWGGAGEVHLQGRLATPVPANLPLASDESWDWWTNLQPYDLEWKCHAADVHSPKLKIDEMTCAGSWRAPQLMITNVEARLYEGGLAGHAVLDVATRAFAAGIMSDFDPRKLSPLLTEEGRRWLEQLSWVKPPRLQAEVSLVLPAWTNRQPDWRAEVQPGINLSGEFQLENGGTYRRVPIQTAGSHFFYSNLCWYLPDLTLSQPEGKVLAEHRANDRSKEYYWRLSSTMDLRRLRPLLNSDQQRALDLVTFTQPPAIEAELWGRSRHSDQIGFRAHVLLTNFAFRSQSFTTLQTRLQYTNRFLQFFAPVIERGTQHISADGLAADFNAQRVYLTNGFSTAEPLVIARAIGPKIGRTIEPYEFRQPPRAYVHGTIPMHGEEGADLHFDLSGGPFHWWRFNVPQITGQVRWAGLQVALTNVQAEFYEGMAAGHVNLDFSPKPGTDFEFGVGVSNILLHGLISDVSTSTNHLEGRVSGKLVVTRANTEGWQTVNGFGDLEVRDGLLWDIPVFGVFSPALNGIAPGLGNSRATAGACTFVITNGAVRSEDLEIRSSAFRLQYRGIVDLAGRVDARVDAELLRDMWVVGPLVSALFWPVSKMFEYKITGTLHEPKTEPVYIIPKLMLLPLRPFRAFKGFLPEEPGNRTNAPPILK